MEQKANKEPSVMQAEQGPNLDQINDSGDSGRSKAAPPQLILSRLGKWTLALSFLLCLHQPMANLGGWLGAVIGGAAAGAGASFLVLDALRYAIFGPVIVIFFLGEVLSMLTGSLIPAARNMTLFLTQAVLQIAATIIQALRAFFAR